MAAKKTSPSGQRKRRKRPDGYWPEDPGSRQPRIEKIAELMANNRYIRGDGASLAKAWGGISEAEMVHLTMAASFTVKRTITDEQVLAWAQEHLIDIAERSPHEAIPALKLLLQARGMLTKRVEQQTNVELSGLSKQQLMERVKKALEGGEK